MKCYCYEADGHFIFCAEDVERELEDNLAAAWFEKKGDRFLKSYSMAGGADDAWYQNPADLALLKENFPRLGPSMFAGVFNWQEVLLLLAQTFSAADISWYITGSVSEAVLGVNITPHDIDIVIHTKDFYKAKEVLSPYIVEPFVDNKGTWIMRYFGRICLGGAMIDVVADEKMDAGNGGHIYESILWHGHLLHVEPLQERYNIEISRNRPDRIQAIEAYLKQSKTPNA